MGLKTQDFPLYGRRILITGGTEGAGSYALQNFASNHPDDTLILTCSRNKTKNSELEISFSNVIALTIDLGIERDVKKLIEAGTELEIDTLLLNAAIAGTPIVDRRKYSDEYIRHVNEISQIKLIEGLLPTLRNKRSLVIFISSDVTRAQNIASIPEMHLYLQTKINVESKINELAQMKENANITFLIIHPAHFGSRLHQNVLKYGDESSLHYKRTVDYVAHNELKKPELIGRIFYLISHSKQLFSRETGDYSVPIYNASVHSIRDEEYEKAGQ
jgi:NAD(P)-dependent dehydrogenase (short-subunit alcohol dehydrogenase family)